MYENFHFLHPGWLLALLPLLGLLWLVGRPGNGGDAWRRVVDRHLLPHLLLDRGARARRMPLILLGLGWFATVMALANPAWERKSLPVFRTQDARVIVLDLSQSMNTPDLEPSRLERARYKVADVLQRTDEGFTGLVAFAGDAFAVSPLTDDAGTIQSLLQALDTSIMPVRGSRVDLGLQKAAELLQQGGITDGEVLLIADSAGDERSVSAARALRQQGHRVSVLAVGTEQGTALTSERGSLVRDAQGKVVVPRLDSEALRALAAAGGGRFARISADDRDLDTLLVELAPGLDTRTERSGLETEDWHGRGPWLGLLLLPLGALAFRRGWLLVLPLTLAGNLAVPDAAVAMSWDDLWQRHDQQANQALSEQDYDRAAQVAKDPNQRGAAQFRQGDFAQALESFAAGTGVDASYNRGNALAQLGRYQEAIAAYEQALAKQPGMEDAEYNKARLEELLRQQQQQDQASQGQQAGNDAPQGQQSDAGQRQDGQERTQDGQQQTGIGGQEAQAGQRPEGQDDASATQGGDQGQDQQSADDAQEQDLGSGSQEAGQERSTPDAKQQADADPAGAGERPGQAPAHAHQSRGGSAQGAQETIAQASEDDRQADTKAGHASESARAEADSLNPEQQQAVEQWLRRIPDDPGGLLRRKFLYQYQQRAARAQASSEPW